MEIREKYCYVEDKKLSIKDKFGFLLIVLTIMVLSGLISKTYAVMISPTTLEFNNKNTQTFKIMHGHKEPIGVYFEINKINKDENGKITKTKLDKSPFQFNKPLVVVQPKETKFIKLKYLNKLPDSEDIYEIIIKEKIILPNKINISENMSSKIFVGGKGNKKPSCKVDGNKLIIINENDKHIYLNNKQNPIFINNKNVSDKLEHLELFGWFLPKNTNNVRIMNETYPENTQCSIGL